MSYHLVLLEIWLGTHCTKTRCWSLRSSVRLQGQSRPLLCWMLKDVRFWSRWPGPPPQSQSLASFWSSFYSHISFSILSFSSSIFKDPCGYFRFTTLSWKSPCFTVSNTNSICNLIPQSSVSSSSRDGCGHLLSAPYNVLPCVWPNMCSINW